MAQRKKQGLGESLATDLKKMLGGGQETAPEKKKSSTIRKSAKKRGTTKKPVEATGTTATKKSLKAKFKPRDLNRVVTRGRVASLLSKNPKRKQTKTGRRQDEKFIALPAGKREASKVSTITKADGTTFKRRNPRAVEGNIYTEKRKNRADVFGRVARRGGRM